MAELDPNEIKDIAASIQQLATAVDKLQGKFADIGGQTQSWNQVLEDAVLTIKDLPGHIANGKDLWKEMTKDADLLKKVQKEVTSMVKDDLAASLDEVADILEANNATTDEWNAALREHGQIERQQLDLLDKHFSLAGRIQQTYEKSNTKLLDANKLVKDFGTLVRDPAAGIDGLLGKMGSLPQVIADAKEETGTWGGAVAKVGKDGFGSILGPAKNLFMGGGLLLGGIALATAAFTGLFLLVKNFFNFLDKEVIPATADFNKQIGGTNEAASQLKGQMSAVGAEFQLLGMNFQEGAQLVRDFSESFKSVRISSEELDVAKKTIAEFGLSAQDTGQIMLQFSKQTGSIAGLKTAFMEAKAGAEAFGLPVNTVLRDMGQAPDVLARFGTSNSLEFAKATVKANSYGLAIKDVNQTFGDQFDTFEKASQASANFNAVLGTNINSFELMLETDPTKRLEMLRGELVKNGKEWENLTVFERNLIAENLGVDKSQAALILSSEKQRKKLEAQAAAAKRTADVNAQWEKGIGRIKRTLIAWGAEVDMVMRRVTEFTFALLGMDKPAKEIGSFTKMMTKGFKDLRKTFKDWTDMLKGNKQASMFIIILQTIVQTVKDLASIISGIVVGAWKTLDNVVNTVFKQFNNLYDLFLNFKGGRILDGLAEYFIATFTNIGEFIDTQLNITFGEEMWGKIKTKAIAGVNTVAGAIKSVWKGLTDWLSKQGQAIGEFFSPVTDLITAAADKVSGGIDGLFGGKAKTQSVDDALITKAGKVIELNPNDNILATKNPVMPTPMATASPVGVAAPAAALNLPARAQAAASGGATAQQATIEPKIEVLRFEIDGKRIAEAQVRISRA